MKKENLKLFVGGYYDERIFEGDYFDGKTPFNKEIDTYTLDEVWQLGFVESLKDLCQEKYDKEWYELTEAEQVQAILDYTETDDIAGILYFSTEQEAERYKKQVLGEIEEIELEIEYAGKEQDAEGFYRDVYVKDPEIRQAKLVCNKSGSGSTTFRATLPQSWIRKMGLSEENRDIELEFDGESIIVSKSDE